MKRKREKQPRRGHGHQKPDNSAADGEQDALRERLRNDLPGRGAHGQSNCRLPTPRYPASQQQIRHVGAGDQQHQAAHREQDLQAAPVLLFHHCHARSGRYDINYLLGKYADHVRHPIGGIPGVVLQPLAEQSGETRSHAINRSSWPQSADHAQPRRDGLMQ